ncbi:hypothetical protein EDB83DRAFT_2527572 [Lactarius deliciosus]|nr:hypothetical protein EDB83DRAFT_2527572 [Lactarius deliciosus]
MAHSIRRLPLMSNHQLTVRLTLWVGSLAPPLRLLNTFGSLLSKLAKGSLYPQAAPHEQPSTHCLVDFVGGFATLQSGVGSDMAAPQHLRISLEMISLEILTPLCLQFFSLSDATPDG